MHRLFSRDLDRSRVDPRSVSRNTFSVTGGAKLSHLGVGLGIEVLALSEKPRKNLMVIPGADFSIAF
jgi:hypothetical protein